MEVGERAKIALCLAVSHLSAAKRCLFTSSKYDGLGAFQKEELDILEELLKRVDEVEYPEYYLEDFEQALSRLEKPE